MKDAANCPGQGCGEREKCMRYKRHAAVVQTWASFDLERALLGGDCPAFEAV